MRSILRILTLLNFAVSSISISFSLFESLQSLQDHFKSCEVIFTSSSTNVGDVLFLDPFQEWNSAGVFIVTGESLGDNYEFRRFQDIHRFNHIQCSIAYIHIPAISESLPSRLFHKLTPRYAPIIRKDEDHFVFVCNNEGNLDDILKSSNFGSKIKYKLGIVDNTKLKNTLLIKSVDLYGNNGEPAVKTVRHSTSLKMYSLFRDTTSNFHGKMLRVANPRAPFYFEMKPNPNGRGNQPVRGLYKIWLDLMMHRYNFTINLFLSSLSGGTGKRLSNGTWLGAVADVLHGKADLAVYIGHIYNRHEFVEWSASYTYEWLVFITQKAQAHFDPTAIFKPFPPILWAGLFASILIICLILKFISTNFAVGQRVSSGNTLLYVLSSILEQDADIYISYIIGMSPVRVMLSFWLLFALILSTAHRAKLVSLLAFPALSWVPDTFDDLANSNYDVGVNVLGKGGAAYSILSTSKNPVYKKLFDKMEIYPDPAVCLRKALKHKIGCIMWKSVADYTEAKNFTDKFGRKPFRPSVQTTSFIADGYIWEKRAIFRQNFDKLTWSIVETGLSMFWFQSDLDEEKRKRLEWERAEARAKCTSSDCEIQNLNNNIDNESNENLKLIHFIGLFYAFALGHFCAILCFFSESRHILRGIITKIYKKVGAVSLLNTNANNDNNELNLIVLRGP